MNVSIIDYGMSNLYSVKAACEKVGFNTSITYEKQKILDSDIAILPGVGAFGEAMNRLKERELDICIKEFIDSEKFFVGICLGLQLLFEKSEEFGSFDGLGLVKGSVKRFKPINESIYPIPHVGWNKIKINNSLKGRSQLMHDYDDKFMYFVHSYYVEPIDESIILSTTNYADINYCSSIISNNIFATQFHPEKSGEGGINIYNQLKQWKKNYNENFI